MRQAKRLHDDGYAAAGYVHVNIDVRRNYIVYKVILSPKVPKTSMSALAKCLYNDSRASRIVHQNSSQIYYFSSDDPGCKAVMVDFF